MKDKLKKLNLRLTELSNYLNFSRPTMYKYIEDYEKRNYSKIDYNVMQVLKFINKKSTISKLQVIDYIINLNADSSKLDDKIADLINTEKKEKYLLKLIDIFKLDNYQDIIDDILNKNLKEKKND